MGKLPPVGGIPGNQPYTNSQFGVFIEEGTNGFILEQNNFSKTENNVPLAYGTYCKNLGRFNNVVRKNTYSNVNVGNFAERTNAQNAPPSRGLHYICNMNTTKNYDFFVDSLGSIRRNQSFENASGVFAAGNVFTKSNSPTGDFNNFGTQVMYFRKNTIEEPLYHIGLAPFVQADSNSCEDNYCLPPCKERAEIEALKTAYDGKRVLYLDVLGTLTVATVSGNDALALQKSDLAAGYRREMDYAANLVSLHIAFDSTTYQRDSLRTWWQKMDSPVSDMVLARDYLAIGRNTEAFAIIDATAAKFNLTDAESSDLVAFRAVMTIVQGERVDMLSEAKVQALLIHASAKDGVAAAWAKNILTLKGYHFPPEPRGLGKVSEREDVWPKTAKAAEPFVVAPNPAKDRVRFSRRVVAASEERIIVTNANGKVVWSVPLPLGGGDAIWYTGDSPGGIYFYSIRGVSGTVQSGKVSIIK